MEGSCFLLQTNWKQRLAIPFLIVRSIESALRYDTSGNRGRYGKLVTDWLYQGYPVLEHECSIEVGDMNAPMWSTLPRSLDSTLSIRLGYSHLNNDTLPEKEIG